MLGTDERRRGHELQTETRSTGSLDGMVPTRLLVPGLTIICHSDLDRIGERVVLAELSSGQEISLSRLEPAFATPGSSDVRPLSDPRLSRKPIRLRSPSRGQGVEIHRMGSAARLAIDGELLGEMRFLEPAEIERGVVLELGRRIALLLQFLEAVPARGPSFGMVGESLAMQRLRAEVQAIADLDVPVLLRGETGTGKELVSDAIHQASPRSEAPFVTVNLAAIPSSLAASELFGAAKGAFTGADRHKEGFFQRAEHGTLFLDEIGEIPGEVQALLLRALENHEIQPVGSVTTRTVDVRVIAATDAKLESEIAAGRFKAPLLHRLAAYELHIPPLRERRDDISRLFFHFVRQEVERLGADWSSLEPAPWRSGALIAKLTRHDWPGNVRQLKNVARRFAIASRTDGQVDLGALLEGAGAPVLREEQAPRSASGSSRLRRKPSKVGEGELLETLRKHRYRLKPAARALGISRASLYVLIENCPKIRKAIELEEEEILVALKAENGDLEAASERLEVSAQGLKRRMSSLGIER